MDCEIKRVKNKVSKVNGKKEKGGSGRVEKGAAYRLQKASDCVIKGRERKSGGGSGRPGERAMKKAVDHVMKGNKKQNKWEERKGRERESRGKWDTDYRRQWIM